MLVHASVDGVSLEKAVLESVRRHNGRPEKDGGVPEPILVLVSTRRLAEHLKRRLVESFGAVLGVHVYTHRALAVRALEYALVAPPQVLPSAALLEIVATLFEGASSSLSKVLPASVIADLKRHVGSRRSLLSAMQELRGAGIGPAVFEVAAREGNPGSSTVLAHVYPFYCRALAELSKRGLVDDAELIERALPAVEGFLRAKRIHTVIHHGAYELVGGRLDLLKACEKRAELHYFLPGSLQARGTGGIEVIGARFVEALRRRFEVSVCEVSGERVPWVERLEGLYGSDRGRPKEVRDAPALEVWHVQGTEEELRLAALRALAVHERDGVPLDEIAIVARSFEKYAPYIEPTFADIKLPFVSSATRPLRRVPGMAAFAQLLRVLARNFERGPFMDLMRSLSVRVPEGQNYGSAVDYWERWSRQFRIVRGLDSWRQLREVCASRREVAGHEDDGKSRPDVQPLQALSDVLDLLGDCQREWSEISSPEDHLRFLRRLWPKLFFPPLVDRAGSDFSQQLKALLDLVEALWQAREVTCGATPSWRMQDVEELIQRLIDSRAVPLESEHEGGVRVLDLMQARGLAHRVVIWVGFQHGVFPARPRSNAFLDDPTREALARATATAGDPRPLFAQEEQVYEERLLLANSLGAVKERAIFTFQRADNDGRKLARSSAFREVARVFTGNPDASRFLSESPENPYRPARLPAHPGEQGGWVAREPRLGLYPGEDALMSFTVSAARGVEAAREFLQAASWHDARLETSLEAIEVLEKFSPEDMRYDGITGKGLPKTYSFSASRLERLGRCPLHFFLSDVLGLSKLNAEPLPELAESRSLGDVVHRCLDLIYRQLPKKIPEGEDDLVVLHEQLVDRLRDIWPEEWKAAFGLGSAEFPGLLGRLGQRWFDSVAQFLLRDLRAMPGAEIEELRCEVGIEGDLVLNDQLSVRVQGRVDRFLKAGAQSWIDDFKTSGGLKDRVSRVEIIRGNELQLAIYRELFAEEREGASIGARLLGVGPEQHEECADLSLEGDDHAGFLETLAVAVELARKGLFPAFAESTACRYCDFRQGCRKSQVPTLKRFLEREELRDYRDCKDKAKDKGNKAVMLEAVRATEKDAKASRSGKV